MPVSAWLCGFEGPRPGGAGRLGERIQRPCGRPPGLDRFPVALAWGKHLFPFRTEQLSPTAPMVLGLHGPGRVGRRRFFWSTSRPAGRLVVVLRRPPRPRRRAPRRGAPIGRGYATEAARAALRPA